MTTPLQDAIDDLQDGITDVLTVAATETGNAISTALTPITTAIDSSTTAFTTGAQNAIDGLSDSLYDPGNQTGILYDLEQGITTLGSNIQLGLAATSEAVDKYTDETGTAITNASAYIFWAFVIIAVALVINAFYVNSLNKTIKHPRNYPPTYQQTTQTTQTTRI